jgi:hypothetical protein
VVEGVLVQMEQMVCKVLVAKVEMAYSLSTSTDPQFHSRLFGEVLTPQRPRQISSLVAVAEGGIKVQWPRIALEEAAAVEPDTSATLLLAMGELEKIILEAAVVAVGIHIREEMADLD